MVQEKPHFQTLLGMAMSWPEVSAPTTAPTALSMTDSRRSEGHLFSLGVSWHFMALSPKVGHWRQRGSSRPILLPWEHHGRHPANDTHYRNVPTPKCWSTGTWRLGADHRMQGMVCRDVTKGLTRAVVRDRCGQLWPPESEEMKVSAPQNIKTWGQNHGPPKSVQNQTNRMV